MTPGKLDAAGISWFGSPVFIDGWNDKITWSATWNEPNMAATLVLLAMTTMFAPGTAAPVTT